MFSRVPCFLYKLVYSRFYFLNIFKFQYTWKVKLENFKKMVCSFHKIRIVSGSDKM